MVEKFKDGETYYFDSFGHKQHLYNGIITIGVGRFDKFTTSSLNIDILKGVIFKRFQKDDYRLNSDAKPFMYKLNDVPHKIKRDLIHQFLSFKYGERPK